MNVDIRVGDSQVDVNSPQAANVEGSPAVKRGGEIVGALIVGSLVNYLGYWIARLIIKLKLNGADAGTVGSPIGYILSGLIFTAIGEAACLIHEMALKILGDRQQFDHLDDPDTATALDRFRQRTWTVISRMEKVEQDVDVVFARMFNIRTRKEIRDQDLQDRQLDRMEILRRAFLEQVADTIKFAIPREISFHVVKAAGYTIFGGHFFIWMYGATFLHGLYLKDEEIKTRIEAEKQANARKRWLELERRPSCEISAALEEPVEVANEQNLEEAADNHEILKTDELASHSVPVNS